VNHLQTGQLDLAALLAETANEDCGALVVFGGTVRDENEGRPVSGMSYSAHALLAEKALTEIEQETLRHFDIRKCRIVHRTGNLALGELSVLVIVRAAHRAAAFDAARHAVEALKQRVAIWKEEHYADGGSRYLEGVPVGPAANERHSP
jgi:molybdopterin synthase catalytic subunit